MTRIMLKHQTWHAQSHAETPNNLIRKIMQIIKQIKTSGSSVRNDFYVQLKVQENIATQ